MNYFSIKQGMILRVVENNSVRDHPVKTWGDDIDGQNKFIYLDHHDLVYVISVAPDIKNYPGTKDRFFEIKAITKHGIIYINLWEVASTKDRIYFDYSDFEQVIT